MGEILQSVSQTFFSFFDWGAIQAAFGNSTNWGIILSLIVIEGLLSADNAIVLAAFVKHLPEHQRKKALKYGMIGAFVFRFLAIGFGVFLVKIAWIKIVGASYLLYIAIKHFLNPLGAKGPFISQIISLGIVLALVHITLIQVIAVVGLIYFTIKFVQNKDDVEEGLSEVELAEKKGAGKGFWPTVIAVELMDITFSVDSILAAFGVSNQVWVLFVGGILGIAMMRMVAGVFVNLLESFPEMVHAAFALIFIIGVKMILGSLHIYEMSHTLFFIIMIGTFAVAYLKHKLYPTKATV